MYISSNLLQVNKSIHVKTINDTTNEKDSLKIEGVKSFFNLWLFAILLMLNYLFNPYSAVPDISIKTLV